MNRLSLLGLSPENCFRAITRTERFKSEQMDYFIFCALKPHRIEKNVELESHFFHSSKEPMVFNDFKYDYDQFLRMNNFKEVTFLRPSDWKEKKELILPETLLYIDSESFSEFNGKEPSPEIIGLVVAHRNKRLNIVFAIDRMYPKIIQNADFIFS